jgi:hypothetical protein
VSSLHAITYDYAVAITKSDTVNDPAGPFSGLLCSAAGTAIVWTLGGPQSGLPLTITCVVGQTLAFPIVRVGVSSGGTFFGLVGAIVRQGF